LAAESADAAVTAAIAKGAAAAVWAIADGRPLWWNEAGAALFRLPQAQSGGIETGAARERADRTDRPWLEIRRFSIGARPTTATLLLGRARLSDGNDGLIAVATSIAPPILATGREIAPAAVKARLADPASPANEATAAEPAAKDGPPADGAEPALGQHLTSLRRLTWQTDAAGRLLAGPGSSLSQALGRGAPMQPVLLRELFAEGDTAIGETIASGRPFAGMRVETLAAPDGASFVGALFGAPVLDQYRRPTGYRGFLNVAGMRRPKDEGQLAEAAPDAALLHRARMRLPDGDEGGTAEPAGADWPAAEDEQVVSDATVQTEAEEDALGRPQAALASGERVAMAHPVGQLALASAGAEPLLVSLRPAEVPIRPSNVIALRRQGLETGRAREHEPGALSPAERDAFADIAKALGASFAAPARQAKPETEPPAGPEAEGEAVAGPASPAFVTEAPAKDLVAKGLIAKDLAAKDLAAKDLAAKDPAAKDLAAKEAEIRDLRALLDGAIDGVVTLDGLGRILAMNHSAERLFGYRENEIAGEALAVLVAPEFHRAATAALESAKARPAAGPQAEEITGRERDGRRMPLSMKLFAGVGPAPRLHAVFRDLTAAKHSEAGLVEARVAAERMTAQKSEFLAKVSHEIRTPLNSIVGFADIIAEERFGPLVNERYKEYVRDIRASGMHIISLVNDLLDLSKIEAGHMELSFAHVSLNAEVSSGVSLVQMDAARSRVLLRQSLAQGLPAILADARAVKQIVLNILSNAVKFTEAGGQVIVSTVLSDRGEVIFRVRDTGIGMSQRELAEAMEPFKQFATALRPGGSGLGLSLTKALVKANHANLSISSNPNEGTLVEIVFPQDRVIAI